MSTTSELVAVPKLENKPSKNIATEKESEHISNLEHKNDLTVRKELENGLVNECNNMNGDQDSEYENEIKKSDDSREIGTNDDEIKPTKESISANNSPPEIVNNELNGLSNDVNVECEEQPPNVAKVQSNIDEVPSNKDIEMDEEKLLSDSESVDSASMNEDKLLNSDDDSNDNKVEMSSTKDVLTNGGDATSTVNNASNQTGIKTEIKDDKNDDSLPPTDNTEPLTEPAAGSCNNSSSNVKNEPSNDVSIKKENSDMEVDDENATVTGDTTKDIRGDVQGTNKEDDNNADVSDDENDTPIEDVTTVDETDEERRATRLKIQIDRVELLKEELRGEESTLTLLRKLFDSQRGKGAYKSSSKSQTSVPTVHSKQAQMQVPPQQQKSSMPLKPPPVQQKPSSHNTGQPVQKFYIQVGNQLVPAPPPSNTSSSGSNYQYANGTTPHSYQPQPPPPPKPVAPPKQTPEQKKNAAKAALRRQLEQTLLQIPPPRPPPADWKAVPNVNSMDFMMLVGLDEVVDTILDMDNKPTLKKALEELTPYNPRICSQCQVDFSPCWKATKDNNLDGFVLCERCALQNVKKELKAEHTSRLKSAFMKALKQEQEIEEKIKAGEEVNIAGITGSEKQDSVQSSHSPNASPHQPSSNRNSSPKLAVAVPPAPSGSHGGHAPSPPERHHQHQPNSGHHHRHQVVQHYPHHTSLVQQLHHQHIQQQQLELEPPSPRHSSRWHPYMTTSSSSHHRDHHPVHHRSYVPASSNEGSPRQEYYVVHHPHQNVRYVTR